MPMGRLFSDVTDVGDVPFPRVSDNEDCMQQITDFHKDLDRAWVRPVSIGGDHSISGGIVQALGNGHIQLARPICASAAFALLTLQAAPDGRSSQFDSWAEVASSRVISPPLLRNEMVTAARECLRSLSSN